MECYFKDICMFDVSQKEKKNDMHELVELNRAWSKMLSIAHLLVTSCGFLGWTDLRTKNFYLVAFYTASFGVPHRKHSPSTCCLISCEAKKVVYHQVSDLKFSGTLLPWSEDPSLQGTHTSQRCKYCYMTSLCYIK